MSNNNEIKEIACFMLLGGGVGDAYQPADAVYRLARSALKCFHEYNWPVHILTKSTLVLRDLDLIRRIHANRRAIVSMSFSTVDPERSALLEPGVPSPAERLDALAALKAAGIPCGMFLMPVVPFITDSESLLAGAVEAAQQTGLDFLIFGGMTLKEGRQKQDFLRLVEAHYPDKLWKYKKLYKGDPWGQATATYCHALHRRFYGVVRETAIPLRIPPRLTRDLLSLQDLTVVILEQIDYLLRLRDRRSAYGKAAGMVAGTENFKRRAGSGGDGWRGLPAEVQDVIHEIVQTRSARLLENLLTGRGTQGNAHQTMSTRKTGQGEDG